MGHFIVIARGLNRLQVSITFGWRKTGLISLFYLMMISTSAIEIDTRAPIFVVIFLITSKQLK